jgi:hypothetical protein
MHVYSFLQEIGVYNLWALAIAIVIYAYIVLTGATGQNLATWISWAMLDTVATFSLYAKHGNWYLVALYVCGSSFVSHSIWKSATFKWGTTEKICVVMVIVCIVAWKIAGPDYATVGAVIGVSIATWPQIKDSILNPSLESIKIYGGFTIVNILATVAGKAWTIEERLYPATCTVLCALIVIACSRIYFKPRGV